jgi:hypothetical protein
LCSIAVTPVEGFFRDNSRALPKVPVSRKGKFGARIDDEHPGYLWWFAFHQVKGLPEKVLEGRFQIYQDFLLDYQLTDPKSIGSRDRAIYAAAYASPDAIRAGDAWYQAFPQHIIDSKTHKKLEMPVLGLGATGYPYLRPALTPKATNLRLVNIENSGRITLSVNDFTTSCRTPYSPSVV